MRKNLFILVAICSLFFTFASQGFAVNSSNPCDAVQIAAYNAAIENGSTHDQAVNIAHAAYVACREAILED